MLVSCSACTNNATKLQLIQDKVNSTVQGANITVEHTEAQYSLGNGILLQVDGRLTLPEEVRCVCV